MTAASSASWDPSQYERFADERARPFHELISRVRAGAPSYVVDLGCGTGALTASMADRWPGAQILGVDSSPDMLRAAAAHAVPGRITFARGDIAGWRGDRPVDVLVTNAALQWIPGHVELLPRLVAALAPGGWLAIQVPGNFAAPSHLLLHELAASPRWAEPLRGWTSRPGALDPADYLAALAGLGCTVDAWEATYSQVLPGEDPVLEWTRGTALRPVLDRLDADRAAEFEAEYAALLRVAYPRRDVGTVFAFRRVFAVAHAPGGTA